MTKAKPTNYPIGDFLIRLKNASRVGNVNVELRSTKFIKAVADVLKKEGYLSEVSLKDGVIKVTLAKRNKRPVLMDLALVSKPGLRHYAKVDELAAKKGPEIYIVSTPSGVMSSRAAIKGNTGGEIIAKVW